MSKSENPEAALPPEFASSDRQVRLTAAGGLVVLVIVALLVASVWLPVLLHGRIQRTQRQMEQFTRTAATTDAEIIRIVRRDGQNGRVRVTYRFFAGGEPHTAEASVRRRQAGPLSVGSRIPVRYLPSDPEQSWLNGQRPRSTPTWLVFMIPPSLLALAVTLMLLIRRQSTLLANGRAALATVMKTEKLRGRDTSTWRVDYEWHVLSGATRRGRYNYQKKTPPSLGSRVPILYDRDDPRRHVRYPLTLVRIAGARRALSHNAPKRLSRTGR